MNFIRKRIKELIRGSESAIEQAVVTGDLKRIDRITGEINALKISGKPVKPGELECGSAGYVKDFLSESPAKDYLVKTREMILKGGYIPEFFFAGAATRLELGPMYFLDPCDMARVVLNKPSNLGKEQEERLRQKLSGLKSLRAEIAAAVGKACGESRPRAKYGKGRGGMGLGQRQLAAYTARLAALAKESGIKPENALEKTQIIIHVNEEICNAILEDLKSHDFYGFSGENIFILIQPAYPGCVLRKGRLCEDSDGPKIPFGHGHATIQLVQEGAAFRLDSSGRRAYLKEDLLSFLTARGARIIGAHRINDITRLTKDVININCIALALNLIEKGRHVVVELVSNPANQKGGNWVRLKNTGQEFLVEGINMKSPGLEAFLKSLTNPPYSAFRNICDIAVYSRILKRSGLPFSLRHKAGRLYLESATGDITQDTEIKSAAIRKDEKEVIHDFKDITNLPDTIRMIGIGVRSQDFKM